MKKNYLLLNLLLIFLISACQPITSRPNPDGNSTLQPSSENKTISHPPEYIGLNQTAFGPYSAAFDITMMGSFTWKYHLTTRFDGLQTEYFLHLEGLKTSLNPGDIRLVTDGVSSRMETISGSTSICSQFPADYKGAPSFLTPENLLTPSLAVKNLTFAGYSEMLGHKIAQYNVENATLGNWPDARLSIALDDKTGGLIIYDISAVREDPLFGAGSGAMSAHYEIKELSPQVIDPVNGCEISFPVSRDATEIIYLPGIYSYQTQSTMDQMKVFYKDGMSALGWQLQSEDYGSTDPTLFVLVFGKDNEVLTIKLKSDTSNLNVILYLP